jgi:site-specific DNA-methyltransferase (adenine-specific)
MVKYYGGNLEILRNDIARESVDLIYLDPPFNSDATYNVLLKSPSDLSSLVLEPSGRGLLTRQ